MPKQRKQKQKRKPAPRGSVERAIRTGFKKRLVQFEEVKHRHSGGRASTAELASAKRALIRQAEELLRRGKREGPAGERGVRQFLDTVGEALTPRKRTKQQLRGTRRA